MTSAFSARTSSRPSFLTSVLPLSSLREQSSPSGKASNSSLRRLKQVGTTWSSPTCLRLFLTESLKRLPYRQASFCGVLLKRTTASPLKGGLPFRMKSWRPSTLPILARVSGTSSRDGQSLSRNLSLPKTVLTAKPLKPRCNTASSTTLNKKGLRTLFIFRLFLCFTYVQPKNIRHHVVHASEWYTHSWSSWVRRMGQGLTHSLKESLLDSPLPLRGQLRLTL